MSEQHSITPIELPPIHGQEVGDGVREINLDSPLLFEINGNGQLFLAHKAWGHNVPRRMSIEQLNSGTHQEVDGTSSLKIPLPFSVDDSTAFEIKNSGKTRGWAYDWVATIGNKLNMHGKYAEVIHSIPPIYPDEHNPFTNHIESNKIGLIEGLEQELAENEVSIKMGEQVVDIRKNEQGWVVLLPDGSKQQIPFNGSYTDGKTICRFINDNLLVIAGAYTVSSKSKSDADGVTITYTKKSSKTLREIPAQGNQASNTTVPENASEIAVSPHEQPEHEIKHESFHFPVAWYTKQGQLVGIAASVLQPDNTRRIEYIRTNYPDTVQVLEDQPGGKTRSKYISYPDNHESYDKPKQVSYKDEPVSVSINFHEVFDVDPSVKELDPYQFTQEELLSVPQGINGKYTSGFIPLTELQNKAMKIVIPDDRIIDVSLNASGQPVFAYADLYGGETTTKYFTTGEPVTFGKSQFATVQAKEFVAGKVLSQIDTVLFSTGDGILVVKTGENPNILFLEGTNGDAEEQKVSIPADSEYFPELMKTSFIPTPDLGQEEEKLHYPEYYFTITPTVGKEYPEYVELPVKQINGSWKTLFLRTNFSPETDYGKHYVLSENSAQVSGTASNFPDDDFAVSKRHRPLQELNLGEMKQNTQGFLPLSELDTQSLSITLPNGEIVNIQKDTAGNPIYTFASEQGKSITNAFVIGEPIIIGRKQISGITNIKYSRREVDTPLSRYDTVLLYNGDGIVIIKAGQQSSTINRGNVPQPIYGDTFGNRINNEALSLPYYQPKMVTENGVPVYISVLIKDGEERYVLINDHPSRPRKIINHKPDDAFARPIFEHDSPKGELLTIEAKPVPPVLQTGISLSEGQYAFSDLSEPHLYLLSLSESGEPMEISRNRDGKIYIKYFESGILKKSILEQGRAFMINASTPDNDINNIAYELTKQIKTDLTPGGVIAFGNQVRLVPTAYGVLIGNMRKEPFKVRRN